jgi:hypothetical protein
MWYSTKKAVGLTKSHRRETYEAARILHRMKSRNWGIEEQGVVEDGYRREHSITECCADLC